MSINLEEFEVIQPTSGRQQDMVISILKDGSVNFNHRLMEKFPQREVEIRMHKDSKKILIKDNPDVIIKLNKNGRIKNYNILQSLEKNKIKFPAYYVMGWDEETGMWVGELCYENPNKGKNGKDKRRQWITAEKKEELKEKRKLYYQNNKFEICKKTLGIYSERSIYKVQKIYSEEVKKL